MKNKKTLLIALLSLSSAGLNLCGQSSPTPKPAPAAGDDRPNDHPPAPPWLKALDADQDGTISSTEMSNAPAALRTLDTNKDGILTPDEMHPMRPHHGGDPGDHPPGHNGDSKRKNDGDKLHDKGPRNEGPDGKRRGPRPPHSPVMKALDADDNHQISPAELDGAPTRLKTLDRNNDGQLSGDEIHPPRPPRPPREDRPEMGEEGPEAGDAPQPPE